MTEPAGPQNPPVDFGRLSLWRDSSGLDDKQAREHAERLELRAKAASETAIREQYLDLFGVKPGERVLDVGCGSGAVTRSLAHRVMPGGQAIGIDTSPALLNVARELADEAGVGDVAFEVGDCRKLPYPDEAFDAVIAATTLCHVPGAQTALAEMARVTRRGGRVGVFDLDGDLSLFSHSNRGVTRKIVAAYSDEAWVNSLLVRELPARLTRLGVLNVKVRGFLPIESGGYYANRAQRSAEAAAKLGAITLEERDRWLEELQARLAANEFMAGQVHLFVWGTRA